MSNESPRNPARVLVTGASGNIGTATVEHLVAQGIAVTALSLDGPFPPGADRAIAADASSADAVAGALEGVDAVVHLAAIPHPRLGTPREVFTTNVVSTFTVLEQAGEHGIPRAVIASSINALGFPMNRHRPMPAHFPLDEDMPTDPEDAYSLSKLVDETTARMAARRWGMAIVALRFPFVKGERGIREQAARERADPASRMREGWSYLDVRDAARAIHLALTAPLEGAHVIGVAAADTMLDTPTADALAEFAPGVPLTRPIPGHDSAVDTGRAKSLLGFTPNHSIHDREQP